MKRITMLTILFAFILTGIAARPVQARADGGVTIDDVRAVTAAYHNVRVAQAAGYNLVPGLDYCFINPGVGGMGMHYINTALLDTVIDPLHPEAMVYEPRSNGTLKLGAVEYIVPIAAWDATHSQPPELFGQVFGQEPALGVYELHAWIWRHNPTGLFSEWNPRVTCP